MSSYEPRSDGTWQRLTPDREVVGMVAPLAAILVVVTALVGLVLLLT